MAENSKIVKTPVGYKVPSQSGNGSYIVNLDHKTPFCTCPDFEKGKTRKPGLLHLNGYFYRSGFGVSRVFKSLDTVCKFISVGYHRFDIDFA